MVNILHKPNSKRNIFIIIAISLQIFADYFTKNNMKKYNYSQNIPYRFIYAKCVGILLMIIVAFNSDNYYRIIFVILLYINYLLFLEKNKYNNNECITKL
jgi:hypothetical protein